MGIFDNNSHIIKSEPSTVVQMPTKELKPQDSFLSEVEILDWFNKPDIIKNKLVCMVLGEDGTGKSGLVLDYIHKKLIENPEDRALILDLDQGCLPLMGHHIEVADRLIVKDPVIFSTVVEDTGEVRIDVKKLMSVIKQVAITVYKNHKEQKITYFVLDGLSKLLEVAESQMRIDINKSVDQGIQTMYWKRRKEHFFGVLDILKSLPVHTFYIGHTNFILTDSTAAVPTQTNAMMFQKIQCNKIKLENGIKLTAEITKSKFNPLKEGETHTFMQVKDGKVSFNSTKIFEGLL